MAKVGRSLQDYLLHLADWIETVRDVEKVIAQGDDIRNQINELALSRALEVVGEICGRLTTEFPEWAIDKREFGLDDAYRLRNKIIHGYDTLDTRLLLVIARQYIPSLQSRLTEWLAIENE
jgi:uncharacterized protein with HEPN domain